MDFDVDFVVTWVDGNDPKWKNKRKKYIEDSENARFRDYHIFKYWFRAVEKYAPWVRKIYLVTDNQIPEWLNLNAEKLQIVDHKEIIDAKYLPTFNSNAIELNINKIKGLSEHFVLFNDDMFLNDYVTKNDFFDIKTGLPRDIAAQNAIMPVEDFDHITANNMITINKRFNKKDVLLKSPLKYFNIKYGYWNIMSLCLLPWPRFTRFIDPHIPYSFLKSVFSEVININKEYVKSTFNNKARDISDISIYAIRYYQLVSGIFIPRSYRFGKKYNLNQINKISKDIINSKHKVICINDTNEILEKDFNDIIQKLQNVYNSKLNIKSDFEL